MMPLSETRDSAIPLWWSAEGHKQQDIWQVCYKRGRETQEEFGCGTMPAVEKLDGRDASCFAEVVQK